VSSINSKVFTFLNHISIKIVPSRKNNQENYIKKLVFHFNKLNSVDTLYIRKLLFHFSYIFIIIYAFLVKSITIETILDTLKNHILTLYKKILCFSVTIFQFYPSLLPFYCSLWIKVEKKYSSWPQCKIVLTNELI